ncbi:MAG: hypothetical protein LAC70_06635 [Methylovulum sp.]|jgi:hypothetical protein|nr:hypothetical protein [Methylovulum sp.]
MKLSRNHLIEAEKKGLLTEHQAEQLWQFLSERTKDNPRLCLAHVLYYVGGLIAISAMSLFMTLRWERFGGIGVFLIALAYGGVGLWLTEFFLTKYHLARSQAPADPHSRVSLDFDGCNPAFDSRSFIISMNMQLMKS